MSEYGYGKPPKEYRFKPGKSGNPSGRPKGAKSLKSLVLEELSVTMEASEDGKRVKISKGKAAVKVLVSKALGGDLAAMRQLMGLMATFLAEPEGSDTAQAPLTESDAALLKAYVERVSGTSERKEKEAGDE